MKKIYFRVVNWNLKNQNKEYQYFSNVAANNDIAGIINIFARDTNSNIKDLRVYIFESKKQYDTALDDYVQELRNIQTHQLNRCFEII